MTENLVFLHAGYNKTATTYLQQRVFKPVFGESLSKPGIKLNDLQLDRKNRDNPLLFSDESLLGVTIFKRHECRNQQRFNFLDNWSKLAPNTRFILCIRKHDEFIESLYRQYLQVGGDLTPEEFINVDCNRGFIKIEELLYEPILNKLNLLFPEPHFIYDFEDFRASTDNFKNRLFKFMKVESERLEDAFNIATPLKSENTSVDYRAGSVLRTINKFVESPLQPDKPISIKTFKFFSLGRTQRQLAQKYSRPKKCP